VSLLVSADSECLLFWASWETDVDPRAKPPTSTPFPLRTTHFCDSLQRILSYWLMHMRSAQSLSAVGGRWREIRAESVATQFSKATLGIFRRWDQSDRWNYWGLNHLFASSRECSASKICGRWIEGPRLSAVIRLNPCDRCLDCSYWKIQSLKLLYATVFVSPSFADCALEGSADWPQTTSNIGQISKVGTRGSFQSRGWDGGQVDEIGRGGNCGWRDSRAIQWQFQIRPSDWSLCKTGMDYDWNWRV
jgi:hypothetical protein